MAAALALYLPPGKTLELRLTNNHYSMISVRRKSDGYRLRLHQMFVGAEPRVVRALARYVVHNDRRASTLAGRVHRAAPAHHPPAGAPAAPPDRAHGRAPPRPAGDLRPPERRAVRRRARKLGFSRQFNRKTHEGASHPDRNAQFEHINASAARSGGRPAGHLRRHEEEGAGGRLQEWRQGLAAEGRPEPRQGARLRGQGARQGHPLRRLRHRPPMPAGSASASRTTRPSSRSTRSDAGRADGRQALQRYAAS